MKEFDMLHYGIFWVAIFLLFLSTIFVIYFIFTYGFIAPYNILAGMVVLGYVFTVYILLTER